MRMGMKSEFTKYDLYRVINNTRDLAYYLPPSGIFNDFNELLRFIEVYERVILKPDDLFCDRKICIIEKLGDKFRITDSRKKKNVKILLADARELHKFLSLDENNFTNYIVQKYVRISCVEQSVFDIRTLMKKDMQGKWKLGEVECIAGGNKFFFNKLYGNNHVLPISSSLKKSLPLNYDYEEIINEVSELCEKLCVALDSTLQYYDEVSFDITIDEKKRLWITEINISNSLKKFMVVDYSTYMSIGYNLLLYTASLYSLQN